MNHRCAQLALAAGLWLVGASGCAGPEPGADPGMETGPCVEGDCFDGLMCLSSLCVSDDEAAGSEGGGDGSNPDDGAGKDDGADGAGDDAPDGAGDAADDSADDGGGDGAGDGDDAADDAADDAGDDAGDEAGDDAGDDGTTEEGPCCVAVETPGCSDAAIEACVCQADAFCCDNSWDAMCVANSAQCGQTCPTPETGPCCTASTTAGCGDADVEACVCGALPDCCTNEWHLLCTLSALQCGAAC